MRLTEKSYQLGLADSYRYQLLLGKKQARDALIAFIEFYSVKPEQLNDRLAQLDTTPLAHGCKLIELVSRPQLTLNNLSKMTPALQHEIDKIPVSCREEIAEAAEILIKYSGYIRREKQIADKINRLENIYIRGKFNYNDISSLSTEARQKLSRIDPETLPRRAGFRAFLRVT